jgi:hypothetical protein
MNKQFVAALAVFAGLGFGAGWTIAKGIDEGQRKEDTRNWIGAIAAEHQDNAHLMKVVEYATCIVHSLGTQPKSTTLDVAWHNTAQACDEKPQDPKPKGG